MNTLEAMFERVRVLVKRGKEREGDRYNVDTSLRSMTEEVGEVATARNVELGYKNRKLKETSAQEAVDVILCGMELLLLSDWSQADTVEYMDRKIKKWEKRMDELDQLDQTGV